MKKKWPPYVEFKKPDANNIGTTEDYLLCTEYPYFYTAAILKLEAAPGINPNILQVTGYNVYLLFTGSLYKHYFAATGPDTEKEVREILTAMADWYLIHVIGKRLSEFDRFRM